jgi:PTH1 family peptidyl-tRNA hydrolase
MITVVGLGNPGDEYKDTRHNAGRIVLELLAKKHDFSDWRLDKKAKALVCQGTIEKKKMQFVLPDNFMNNSGGSVKPFVVDKKTLAKLVVVYDELDVPIGSMKISFNRSSGGHNGVESIIKAVKSQEFVRVRVGISPHTPGGKLKKPTAAAQVDGFLLKKFKDAEMAELKKIAKRVEAALVCFAESGKDKMMTLYNQA